MMNHRRIGTQMPQFRNRNRFSDGARLFAESVRIGIIPTAYGSFVGTAISIKDPDSDIFIHTPSVIGGNYGRQFNYDFKPGTTKIRINASSGKSYRIVVNGVPGKIQISNGSYVEFDFNSESLQSNNQPQTTTRYKITSPDQNGLYTESVQELSSFEIASLRLRGYTVENTLLPLQSATKSSSNTISPKATRLRQQGIRGRPHRGEIQFIDKKQYRGIVHRSSTNPGRMFREEPAIYGIEIYHNNRIIGTVKPITITVLREYRRRYTADNGYRTHIFKVYDKEGNIRNRVNTGVPGSIDNTKYDTSTILTDNTNQQTNTNTQELRNLKTWIESINSRLSSQVTDLGDSTNTRSNENQELAIRLEQLNARVSQQLIDLGNATSDISKAIANQKAEQVINDAKKSLENTGGTFGGVFDFISGNNILPIILVGVVLLVMLRK